jgi:CubicO group peptidase (beta-lactamase class C family)
MTSKARGIVSRRKALAGLAATAASVALGEAAPGDRTTERPAGPLFSPSGPNAELYGAAEGFPVADASLRVQPGEPHQRTYRVGAYSHFDEIYPTHLIKRATTPWLFKRSPANIHPSITDYLSRNPVTGLLIAKDDQILCEHYQYGRTDRDKLLSQSMAKSITGMLIGIAIAEGAIKSVRDAAETYVAGFKGTEYGATPIRDLLHMSSGVDFGETRDGQRDLNRLWVDMVLGMGPTHGTIESIAQFNQRVAPAGTRYFYASIEADVLGVVLHYAVSKSVSDYLREKIWQPIGAEVDATWVIDAQGFEVAHGFFSAVLRDYARLGRLLAHDGNWDGKQIIPAEWLIEATTVRSDDAHLAPGRATPTLGYGYFLWLLPGARRQFAMVGANGQRLCVDPSSKLVMVQTAVENTDEVWRLWSSLVEEFGQG